MTDSTKGVILVGHGGIPKGYSAELVTKLKRLEAQRRAAGTPMSDEEYELDQKIRLWPRTPEIDPYQAGLEKLATHLKPLIDGAHFSTAYNEFCTPTLEEAIENIDIGGPSMLRSASKNYRSVGVVVNPERYDELLKELKKMETR